MSWLARLKKLESTPAPSLQNLQKAEIKTFVGFVGPTLGPFPKSSENDTFAVRVALFTGCDLSMDDAETMAYRLECRDREHDDRQLCLECLHLYGSSSARRCGMWQALGIHSPAIPTELVTLLQRCNGFHKKLEVTP